MFSNVGWMTRTIYNCIVVGLFLYIFVVLSSFPIGTAVRSWHPTDWMKRHDMEIITRVCGDDDDSIYLFSWYWFIIFNRVISFAIHANVFLASYIIYYSKNIATFITWGSHTHISCCLRSPWRFFWNPRFAPNSGYSYFSLAINTKWIVHAILVVTIFTFHKTFFDGWRYLMILLWKQYLWAFLTGVTSDRVRLFARWLRTNNNG